MSRRHQIQRYLNLRLQMIDLESLPYQDSRSRMLAIIANSMVGMLKERIEYKLKEEELQDATSTGTGSQQL